MNIVKISLPSYTMMMKLILLGFAAIMVVINIATLNDGHNWGGDFGQYIKHAENLINGKPYASGIIIEQAIVYPPGFPLIIAPLLEIFGLNFKILKSINIVFWLLSLFILFRLIRLELSQSTASLIIALLCASSFFFTFKQNILSDIPFLFLTMLAMWAIEKKYALWSAIILSCLILTRSAGIVLSATAVFYFLFIKRDRKIVWAAVFSIIAATAVQTWIIGGMHPAFWKTMFLDPMNHLIALARGSSTVWESMLWVLCPAQNKLTSWIFTIAGGMIIIFSPILYGLSIFFFIQQLRHKALSFIQCFCFFYLLMLFIWAGFGDSPQNFARFTLPIIGLTIMLTAKQMIRRQREAWLKILLGILIGLNVFNIAGNFNYNDDELIVHQPNRALFAWIREHLSPSEHYMIWEPRTIALMTERVGTTMAWFKFAPLANRPSVLQQWGINYVILNPLYDKDLITYFDTHPSLAHVVWKIEGHYMIYKIN